MALDEAAEAAREGEVPVGAVEHGARVFEQDQCLHRPEIYHGMGEAEAAAQLRDFFRARR
jgi:tRNA(adenine34) deaminase